MKSLKIAAVATALIISTSANAVILNTLNGVNYQWLELTATMGMSRDEIEAQLTDSTSILYGYEYASRSQFQSLLSSYISWDGLSGYHGAKEVVADARLFLDDFGVLGRSYRFGTDSFYNTVDGFTVAYDGYETSTGIYGLDSECGDGINCLGGPLIYQDAAGKDSMTYQDANSGYDISASPGTIPNDVSRLNIGSYLVTIAPVPVPAAVWLFGSGLIGLAGFARRKKI